MNAHLLDKGGPNAWRLAGWGMALALLALPWIAGAPWTGFDYIFAAVMFALVGGAIELFFRMSSNLAYRAGAGLAVIGCFLLVWVNGAVGFFGDEDNPANLVFLAIILTVVTGAIIARLKAPGMARTAYTAAALQLLIGIVGYSAGWAAPGGQGIYEAVMGTTLFCGIWLASALLFRNAASA